MKITIIEPHASGHRMIYVRRILVAARQRGLQVTLVTTEESTHHPSFAPIASLTGENFDIQLLKIDSRSEALLKKGSYILSQYIYFRLFQSYYKKRNNVSQKEFIFVPYLDYCDKMVSIFGSPFGSTKWGGICMQLKFHFFPAGLSKKPAKFNSIQISFFKRLLQASNFAHLYIIDEVFDEYIKSNFKNLSEKVVFVRDPVDMDNQNSLTREEYRLHYGIPSNKFVLLVYGTISERKNISTLISILEKTPIDSREDFCLFIVGKCDEETKLLLQSENARQLQNESRLFVIDRFVDNEEEIGVFKASDSVWLVYNNFIGMSGVLIQAGKMKKPVISCDSGLIGWNTIKYKLGICVKQDNPTEIIKSIQEIKENTNLAEDFGNNGYKLSLMSSSENFSNTIITTMMDKVNL